MAKVASARDTGSRDTSERISLGRRRTRPEEIDTLLAETYATDPGTRSAAVHALCPCSLLSAHDRVWDRLLEMVSDPDPKVRADIVHTLCDGSPRYREQDVIGALERLYLDPDLKLRRKVRKLLAQYRSGGRINIL